MKAKRAFYTHYNKIVDYKIIKELHESDETWSISFMCIQLGISRAAYYKWLNSSPTEKQLVDEMILTKIKEITKLNNFLFGTMNMYFTLRNKYNFTCGHNRVYRIMCINNIKSSYRRSSGYRYIKSTPEETPDNILKRNFNTNKPNEKWCTDVTEIKVPTTGEKLYISPVLDLYDRYPAGFVVGDRNDTIHV